jgi:hypothetical protein
MYIFAKKGFQMKSIYTLALLFVIQFVAGQNPEWGWALPITVTTAGSAITCSVYDSVLGHNVDTTVNGYSENHGDGMVAMNLSSGGTLAMVYDKNLHGFQPVFFPTATSAPGASGDMVLTGTLDSIFFAAYDPILQQWKIGERELPVTNDNYVSISEEYLIILNSGDVEVLIYEPAQEQWTSTLWSIFVDPFSPPGIYSSNHIVMCQSSGDVSATVYDPGTQSWSQEDWSYSSNIGASFSEEGGVVTTSTLSEQTATIYDFETGNWETKTWNDGSLYNNNGTVSIFSPITGDNTKWGYVLSTHSWMQDSTTTLACQEFTYDPGDPKNIVYLRNLHIGASSDYWLTPQHTITKSWAWKQFNGGVHTDTLVITDDTISKTCDGQIIGGGVGINDMPVTLSEITLYPNPLSAGGVLNIQMGTEAIGCIEMTDMAGKLISAYTLQKGQTEINLSTTQPSAGLYFLRLINSNGQSITKKLVVQ